VSGEGSAALLQAVFEHIRQERMADMPMLNPALRVEAVGFAPWHDGLLGILITPWFMNLMHLPGEQGLAAVPAPGGKRQLVFPSGVYEFISAQEERLGRYEMCSLFSPMFDFPDHATAVATAHEALVGLMTPDPSPAAGEGGGEAPAPAAEEARPAISRRDLLRGSFGRPSREP